MSPFGKVTYRAIDHQSTMGAYLGKTKLEGQKGVMTDYVYIDGAKYLPSDDEVKKLRSTDARRACVAPGGSVAIMRALVLQILTGLASASALFLVASGLSLIFGVTRIVNFAHGSFYMLGLYAAVALTDAFAAPARSASGAACCSRRSPSPPLGALIEILVLRRLYGAPSCTSCSRPSRSSSSSATPRSGPGARRTCSARRRRG